MDAISIQIDMISGLISRSETWRHDDEHYSSARARDDEHDDGGWHRLRGRHQIDWWNARDEDYGYSDHEYGGRGH